AGERGQAPRKLRNLMEERFRLAPGEQAYIRTQRIRTVPLHGVVELMMFNEAAGGRKLTGTWNRYQDFVDLSHALDKQTAMLYGRTTIPQSELLRSVGEGAPTSMRGPRDAAETIYRFV